MDLYDFPQDPHEQLRQAIRAVFDSWNGERAVSYRRMNRIPDEWGTAVNVQQMVFGNKGDDSGSGVAFSRDEVTGKPEPSGDFLVNAQGEDVVSGVRNTLDIAELKDVMPDAYEELMDILRTLERHYKDMQDTEFTVEEGQLYMLQTRNAKRPAQAAVRFAVDAVREELLTRDEALLTIEDENLDALLHPTFDPQAEYEVLATGVAASPGAAVGEIVFRAADAVQAAEDGRDVILVRPFTEADDVAGFQAAKGVLTSEGGKASHAALVARGMGVPAVTGAGLEIDLEAGEVRVKDTTLKAGDTIAIDGTSGSITTDDVPLVQPDVSEEFDTVLRWADELRMLEVRANADTPDDAKRSREFGATGIGLCRTEHMFFGDDRHEKMVAVILGSTTEERRERLKDLLPLQQGDFEAPKGPAAVAAGRLGGLVGGEGGPAGHDPPARPATARVPAGPHADRSRGRACAGRDERRPRPAREDARARAVARGGEPDARHARRPARAAVPRDLRDAGRGDDARRQGGPRAQRPRAAPRDHGAARRLRGRARGDAPDDPRGRRARGPRVPEP